MTIYVNHRIYVSSPTHKKHHSLPIHTFVPSSKLTISANWGKSQRLKSWWASYLASLKRSLCRIANLVLGYFAAMVMTCGLHEVTAFTVGADTYFTLYELFAVHLNFTIKNKYTSIYKFFFLNTYTYISIYITVSTYLSTLSKWALYKIQIFAQKIWISCRRFGKRVKYVLTLMCPPIRAGNDTAVLLRRRPWN